MSLPPRPRRRRFRLGAVQSLAKDGEEGEDHWAAREELGRFVLCDGASEGWDGGGWARTLAACLVRGESAAQAIVEARQAFDKGQVGEEEGWLEERARARGSWSTALVASTGQGGLFLRALAVGDSCLFLLDGYRMLASFPQASPLEFGNAPDLISAEDLEPPPFRLFSHPLARLRRPRLVLASDAMAARLLAADFRDDGEAWASLRHLAPRGFSSWVAEERGAGRLRADDLSLLWVEA
jgi:hypothetical protein